MPGAPGLGDAARAAPGGRDRAPVGVAPAALAGGAGPSASRWPRLEREVRARFALLR